MEEATKNQRKEFKVGDRVYAPFHGYGTVTKICEDKCVYPINVHWDDSDLRYVEEESSFTEDGYLTVYNKTDELRITVVEDKEEKVMANDEKFKVGDHVWSFHFGVGIVIKVNDTLNSPYPITVRWTDNARFPNTCDYFTKEGHFDYSDDDDDWTKDIIHSEEDKKGTKFHLGDRVYAKFRGYGTVTDIYEEWTAYPIEVTWDKCLCKGLERSTYTKEGNLSQHYEREDTMLTVVPKEEK